MKPRSAIKSDLFAAESRARKIDSLGDPLVKISQMVDFAALASEVDRVAPRVVSGKGGRPLFPTETMVRILVLKRLHNLSDEQVEFQLLDRLSFRRFCGLTTAANIPDRTTVWNFDNRIGAIGAQSLFDSLSAQLLGERYLARGVEIIDATLVPAPKQHDSGNLRALIYERATPADWEPAKRRQKDTDATWTKKHGESDFGYKLSVNADRRYKLIRRIETNTARVHDGQHFEAVLDRANTSSDVYSDRGYPSQARDSDPKISGYRPQIQRRGAPKRKLSECQKRRNQRSAKVRARVEHVFAAITQMCGKLIRTIGQARADFGMTMMALCYKIKRLTNLKTAGNAAKHPHDDHRSTSPIRVVDVR